MRKIIFFLIFLGLLSRTFFLSSVPFHDWDEGMYSQIASEMIENKSAVLRFNGELWFDKPFFSYLITAITFLIFGKSEFWARAIMMFVAMIILVLLYGLTKKTLNFFFRNDLKKMSFFEREISYFLPVLTLISNKGFLNSATMLNTDTLLVLSWLGYFLFRSNYILKLIFLSLGVWSKSFMGFFPMFIELLLFRKKDLTLNNLYKFVLLIIIPSVWHIMSLLFFGRRFIEAHFINQLFKRLYIPLELHFGGRLFYPSIIWDNLNIIIFIIIAAYILFTFRIFRGKNTATKAASIYKSIKKLISDREKLWLVIVFYSPIILLAFLTYSITKLEWYYVWFAPMLSIPVAVFFVAVKKRSVRIITLLVVISWSIINFIPQTFAYKSVVDNYVVPERTQVAQCIGSLSEGSLGALVDEKERRAKHVIEAANVASSSTFYWGISVSFVYYANRKVDYYYDIDSFTKNINNYPYIILAGVDRENNENIDIKLADFQPIKKCWIGDWQVYKKK